MAMGLVLIVLAVMGLPLETSAVSLHVLVTSPEPTQRRIYMSDNRVLLNFTNDDDNVMIDCDWTEDAAAIRRTLTFQRRAISDDDVMDAKRTYEDQDGATFAGWKRACETVRRRRTSGISKRKVFPEVGWIVRVLRR